MSVADLTEDTRRDFLVDLSESLGIPEERISISSVQTGSVRVTVVFTGFDSPSSAESFYETVLSMASNGALLSARRYRP